MSVTPLQIDLTHRDLMPGVHGAWLRAGDVAHDARNGIGMTSARTRARMVERLREQGIADEVVLSAMNAVPRHIFVDEALAIRAYDDVPLPIGHGQTISQPWVVARMTELARNGRELDDVLEIGTGCGYQTAVLAHVARHVYSVERIGALVAKARRNLQSLKLKNVSLKHGDGSHDLEGGARRRRDRRHRRRDARAHGAACAISSRAGAWCCRSRNPATSAACSGSPCSTRRPAGIVEQTLDAVRFVPLLSGLA